MLDRSREDRYRATMHSNDREPIVALTNRGRAADRWCGYVYFGYVPPALLAGQEAVSR